ncbi:MAG: prolipoprotein diacylglyceryl transferase [Deinococcales bacterium]|nr:prolipoprotein diacylglyceryl transferase [Deinococcales bacterium]
MDPIFLQLGPIAIRWYGLFIALGVLAGSVLAVRYAARRGLDPEKLLDMALWLVLAGIVGARLVYVITSPSAYFGPGGDPLAAFKVWEGGVSIHGGVIGVVVATWLYSRAHRLNMWSYLDVMSPVAGFGIVGGRLGNIMNGTDTGGRLTNWPIGFTWPEPGTATFGAFGRFLFGDDMWSAFPGVCADGSYIPLWQCGGDIVRGPVHFTQLYGVFIGVAVLLITLWALNRTSKPGFAFWQMVLWYSVLRSVFEETFRDNPLMWNVYLADGLDQPGIGLFTVTQVASVAIIAVAVWMLARVRAQPEAPAVAAGGPGPRGGATAQAPARRGADGSGRGGADGGAKRKAGGKGEGRG